MPSSASVKYCFIGLGEPPLATLQMVPSLTHSQLLGISNALEKYIDGAELDSSVFIGLADSDLGKFIVKTKATVIIDATEEDIADEEMDDEADDVAESTDSGDESAKNTSSAASTAGTSTGPSGNSSGSKATASTDSSSAKSTSNSSSSSSSFKSTNKSTSTKSASDSGSDSSGTTCNHNWVEITKEEDIYETRTVTRCSTCGTDLSSYTNDEISQHVKAHTMVGEATGGTYTTGEKVKVGTQTVGTGTYRCTICGATK